MDINKLAGYIKEKGFTYESLARASGVSKATISRILNGDNATIGQVHKLINTLNMPSELIIAIFFSGK